MSERIRLTEGFARGLLGIAPEDFSTADFQRAIEAITRITNERMWREMNARPILGDAKEAQDQQADRHWSLREAAPHFFSVRVQRATALCGQGATTPAGLRHCALIEQRKEELALMSGMGYFNRQPEAIAARHDAVVAQALAAVEREEGIE